MCLLFSYTLLNFWIHGCYYAGKWTIKRFNFHVSDRKFQKFTCKTAKMMENIVMINRQMATAIAVMAVKGESNRRTNSLLLPSLSKDPCSGSPLL